MARIRSVKPSLRTSRVVAQWPFEVRYFWVLLWGYLDDEGRGLDIPRTILADCFPLDEQITAAKVDAWLKLMARTRRDPDRDPPLCRYEAGGVRYLHCVYWHDDNQRPNRPTPSRIPPCPTHDKPVESLNGRSSQPPARLSEPLTESPLSPRGQEGEGGGGGVKGGGGALTEDRMQPPATDRAGSPPPPPRTCPKHPDGTENPCRACQRAREAHEAWAAEQRARTDPAAKCPKHRGKLAATCPLCRADALVEGRSS